MNKVTHTPGDSPFTQAASGANVSQIESLLCPQGEVKLEQCHSVSMPASITLACDEHQLGQIRRNKLCAHFFQQFTHCLVATGRSHADAFLA